MACWVRVRNTLGTKERVVASGQIPVRYGYNRNALFMHNARRRLRFTDYTYDLHAFHVSATYTSGRESINFRTIGHGRSTIVSTERYTQSRNADTVESRWSTWSAKLDRVVSLHPTAVIYAAEGLSRECRARASRSRLLALAQNWALLVACLVDARSQCNAWLRRTLHVLWQR